MKKLHILFAMALLLPLTTLAQGWPANYGGVMLQGFFWDSYKEVPDCSPWGPWANHQTNSGTRSHRPGYTWATMYGAGWGDAEEWQVPVTTWSSLIAHKDEITPFIDLLWLPQSGSTVADTTITFYKGMDDSGRDGVRYWRHNSETEGIESGVWRYDKFGAGEVITNPDCMGFVPVFYFHHGLSYNPDGTEWTYTDGEGRTWTPISYFGTEDELRELISTYKNEGTGAIEDVVANHRGGLGTWADDKYSIEFPTEWYQGTFCPEGEYITWSSDDVCNDDESGRGSGNPDCGGQGQWARDIDHHSATTRLKIIKFLDFLKNNLGYVGYRYDYAMGFEEKHFAEYNTTLRPTFSVGEYWGQKGDISNWIHKTYMEGCYQSAAFDFPLQSDIREAFNYGNYRYLNESGLISDPVLKRYAVTFLDNHDTFKDLPTDGSNYNYQHRITKNIVEANAFILAMPGTPCLFYPHFMHPDWHPILCLLIKARRTAGITNESERSAAVLKGDNGIEWVVTGNNGQVCFQLGDATDDGCPDGFTTVWESTEVDGKRVARYSITESLYDQIENNQKKNLINGYPVIDRNSCTFSGSMTVNVKPSSEGCILAYTLNGKNPTPNDQIITEETNLTINDNTTLKVGVIVDQEVPRSSIVTRQYVKTATESDKINFYVKDDNAPYIYTYYYDNDGNKHEPLGQWHGYLAFNKVQVGGIDWWHVQMDKPQYPVSLIINWNGSQTPDIDGITSDVFYTVQDGQPNDVTNTYMPMMENPNLTIDKVTGSYEGGVTAKIVSSYSGATIVYTTDGTEPTAISPTIASGSSVTFSTTGNHYLRAGILKDGEVINQVARSYYVENGHGDGVNIYVKNMTTTDVPHIHAWNGEGDAITSPGFDDGGQLLTETATNCGQTWYKIHFDEVPSGILFMLTDRKDMTGNITYLEDGKDYYFYYYPGAHFGDSSFQPGYIDVTADSKHTTDVKAITVFMYDNGNADWSNGIKLYPYVGTSDIFWNWSGSWAESAFPTTTMGGQSWFYCTFMGKDNIGAILYNSAYSNERFEVSNTSSDVFMKFPIANNNWSTGSNETSNYAQYLPQVETPEEGNVTPPDPETIIPDCATSMRECIYFYFENSRFGSPYAWVYSGTKTFGEHGWPGEALTNVVGTAPNGNLVYLWTYKDTNDNPSDIIFTNNGQNQVGPFSFENGAYYTVDGKIGKAHDNYQPLAEVVRYGDLNQEYFINNDITAIFTDKSGLHVFAKDADGEAINMSNNDDGKPVPEAQQDWYFDQSNWVEFVLPTESALTLDDMSLLNHTIVGKLIDKTNPKIQLLANPIPVEEMSYIPNDYLVANFAPMVNTDYFFVAPKTQEYSTLKYAVYRDGKLTMANQDGNDPWDILLGGEVTLASEQPYYEGDTPLSELFEENGVYEMQIITKRNDNAWEVAVVNATKIGMLEELEATPLDEVLAEGVNGNEYLIADNLVVVDVAEAENYAFLTDGKDNWIKVVFDDELADVFTPDNVIENGTLKGTLSDVELNPYLTVTEAQVGEEEVDFNIEKVNLSQDFVLKPNQVIDVKGYWNANDGALRAYAQAPQGQSLTVNTAWAGSDISLVNGTLYSVRAAITLKGAWKDEPSGISLMEYDYDFQNYTANALTEPTTSTPTGVENFKIDNVKSVRYINAAGVESATPFQGVNIVVREYNDGTRSVSKIVM